MKTIIQRIVTLLLTVMSYLGGYAYDIEVNGIYYDIVSLPDLTCKVVKGEVTYTGDIVIPNEISYNNRTLKVIGIDSSTFKYNNVLTSVSLPEALTEISDQAFFDCTSLTSISLPENLTKIGYQAFAGCTSLTSISLPESLTTIGMAAFASCTSLTSISLPENLTTIDSNIFSGCTSLTSISLPESLTTIGMAAFSGCTSLTSISLPENLTTIGAFVFSACTSLTSISLPESLTIIGAFVFSACTSLTSISLSENLTLIPGGLFSSCSNLPKLTISGKVLELNLGDYDWEYKTTQLTTFANCSNLKYLKFEYNNDNEFLVPYYYDSHYLKRTETWGNWEPQLDILYVDRLFKEPFAGTCSQLEIGPNITDVRVNTSGTTSVVSYNLNPPSIPEFTMSQYMDIPVKVPYEALEAYKQAEIWKNFWNIEGFDAAGINNPEINSTKTVIGMYDLNGRYITEDYRGIGIIRYSDGSVKKVIL